MGMEKEGALQHKPDLPCPWDEREGGAGLERERVFLGFKKKKKKKQQQ